MYTLLTFPATVSSFACTQRVREVKEKDNWSNISQFQNTTRDLVSTVDALTFCIASRNPSLGSSIHGLVIKSELNNDVFVNNSLLNMYTKCGDIESAAMLFDNMSERTVVSWTSIISYYSQSGDSDKAISIFSQMLEHLYPNEFTLATLLKASAKKGDPKLALSIHAYILKFGFKSDSFLRNSLIDAYAKSGLLVNSEKLLERSSCVDVVSWTSVISGYVFHGMVAEALILFVRMQNDGALPNEVTILSILHACSLINQWSKIRWIHGLVIKMGWLHNDLVLNSLVEMYLLNGYFNEGIQIFCGFSFTIEGHYLSAETMATLLQGCGHCRYWKLGKQIHSFLIKHRFLPHVIIENSLVDMYGENGQTDSAYKLFTRMTTRDTVSWNSMITCLVKNDQHHEALMLLADIHSCKKGGSLSPDFITMLASIQACSNLASLQLGQVIHGYMTRAGLVADIYIQNALIDLYGRSGKLCLAEQVFKEMPIKDVGSWNSLIAAYGMNGNGTSALQVFIKLKSSSVHQPNTITYVNILSACAYAGLVEEGLEIFKCMHREGVAPRMEHFACMVDLLGRSGRLEEAEKFIGKMPIIPGPAVWGALLGACRCFGHVDVAERAARQLSQLEPESIIWRVALSNVYASVGRWENAAKVRAETRGLKGMETEGGWSSVEVEGDSFKFMVNDTRHPESRLIYQALSTLMEHMSSQPRVACNEKIASMSKPVITADPEALADYNLVAPLFGQRA